jgi:hypothetical protein
MPYWWVNQNQTYRAEIAGGFLWSPKRNNNGARNQFYENMRAVVPGELVLSFRDTHIVALGAALSYCYDAPRPAEFGATGANWNEAGWKVDVRYRELRRPIRPKDHIERIRPLLPANPPRLGSPASTLRAGNWAELARRAGVPASTLRGRRFGPGRRPLRCPVAGREP